MKTLKRLGLMSIVALLVAPLAVQSIGCKSELSEDGVDVEVGD